MDCAVSERKTHKPWLVWNPDEFKRLAVSHSSLQESTELRPKRVLVVVSGCTSYIAGFMVVVWLLLQAFFLVPFGRDVEKPEQSADCNIGRQSTLSDMWLQEWVA